MNKYMQMAIEEARNGIENGHGGPFGCVIVKDAKVIGKGHNCVLKNNDPTAHGEVSAIRDACKNLNTFDLSGSELYTTGEPCPMCLGAILWANIDKVYYGCTIADNEDIGFRDNRFYDIMKAFTISKMSDSDSESGEKSDNKVPELESFVQINREECLKLFADYKAKRDKVNY